MQNMISIHHGPTRYHQIKVYDDSQILIATMTRKFRNAFVLILDLFMDNICIDYDLEIHSEGKVYEIRDQITKGMREWLQSSWRITEKGTGNFVGTLQQKSLSRLHQVAELDIRGKIGFIEKTFGDSSFKFLDDDKTLLAVSKRKKYWPMIYEMQTSTEKSTETMLMLSSQIIMMQQ